MAKRPMTGHIETAKCGGVAARSIRFLLHHSLSSESEATVTLVSTLLAIMQGRTFKGAVQIVMSLGDEGETGGQGTGSSCRQDHAMAGGLAGGVRYGANGTT
ncbi:hypothetical protein OsI_22815 [Oryza sativa Indica Group]|uniref:Uncharacterized protein n=1 Tax=Oryza sativa subsp. indica TaxID=39946 RepID=B8B1C8_ORYSI|nr:hypothetical protein OsI_22815 [Oryza sativa Indica Group]